ncbi:hypothetical protein [Prauserella alba]|nr:hypothetical protein [Prauserella alba]MCP2183567.1 hypothetical protein [Prauserella alba]
MSVMRRGRFFTSSSRGDRWGAFIGIVLCLMLLVVAGILGVVTLIELYWALVLRPADGG